MSLVGTRPILPDELEQYELHHRAKAILDETCENTNVVNELNIPILCMGCKDMIVAASGDL